MEIPNWQTLREAEQEVMNGNASYKDRNSKAYLKEFGKEYEGEMDGECGFAEITN